MCPMTPSCCQPNLTSTCSYKQLLSAVHLPLQCAQELCVLHARAAAATDVHSPFMAVKDKYRRGSEHHASLVVPLAGLPEALCTGGMPAAEPRL